METIRQQKIAKLIQVDLANIFREILKANFSDTMISVTKVHITIDLSIAKVYLSIFPSNQSDEIISIVQNEKKQIKQLLAQKIKQQLRKTPELIFCVDDSLDYIKNIEKLLKK